MTFRELAAKADMLYRLHPVIVRASVQGRSIPAMADQLRVPEAFVSWVLSRHWREVAEGKRAGDVETERVRKSELWARQRESRIALGLCLTCGKREVQRLRTCQKCRLRVRRFRRKNEEQVKTWAA